VTIPSGTKLGRYEIRSQLGAGGMGEVYLTEDTQLGRRVAIKLLSPELVADERANKRLVKEARAAATLDHPNICSIYEVGEADGRSFIAMQYIEGETLDSKLKRKPLELKESLTIASQVADALAEAHSHGIIHRDIKPGNIMITSRGQAKVMDFGLARVIAGAAESEAETRSLLTTPGTIMGTMPYMSPEQLRGETLDARSDIFSFGVLLYEMLAGRQPFACASAAATISAILTQEPPALTSSRAHVSEELQRVVGKCLEKDRERRYRTMRDVHDDLLIASRTDDSHRASVDEAFFEAKTVPLSARATKQSGTGSRAKSVTPRGAALIVGVLALVLFATAAIVYKLRSHFAVSPTPISSLAVLPFTNVNADPEAEYLCDGLTESVINRLSQLPNLKVMSRNSVFRYKGKEIDARDVGQQLGVQSVLTGRVSQHGDMILISLELIDARDGTHLWGAPYDRKLSDLVTVQREIPVDVADNLRITLSGEERQHLTKRYTDNAEAYRLYLKGRYYWDKRTPAAMHVAIDAYNQAIALDPNYALAYDGLADCLLFNTLANLTHREAMLKAKESALKAIELDNTLAEAYTTLAFIKENFDYDPQGAESDFKRAIELNPKYPIAHQFYGGFLLQTGRAEQGLAEARRALEFDPYSLALNWYLGHCLYMTRHYDEALAQLQKTLQMQPDYLLARVALGKVYVEMKRYDDALALFRQVSSSPNAQAQGMTDLAYVYARTGRRAEAQKTLDELREMYARGEVSDRHNDGNVNGYFIAQVYAGLGDKEHAFEWLNKGLNDRAFYMFFLRVDPWFDDLHDDPRFTDLLRRIGLAA
jgi:serine/threonine protein kinase/tetratricopeptide (TPR) repeat protein